MQISATQYAALEQAQGNAFRTRLLSLLEDFPAGETRVGIKSPDEIVKATLEFARQEEMTELEVARLAIVIAVLGRLDMLPEDFRYGIEVLGRNEQSMRTRISMVEHHLHIGFDGADA